MEKKLVSSFYENEAPAYAAADNIRKIASYIDGLKLSQRKLIYTIFEKFPIEKIKTAQFANFCAAFTNYNQGEANLGGVASNMAQDFCGSNNFPPLKGLGNFGNRLDNSPAATRYTYVKQGECLKSVFNEVDRILAPSQIYEGSKIEPVYFVPVIPFVLLNGSEGLSTGFKQLIYPRNLKDIVSYIKKKLSGVEPRTPFLPYFEGYKGQVRVSEDGLLEIVGNVERKNSTTYIVHEIPITVQYTKYCDFLDKLRDNGTIMNFEDKCDPKTNEIRFEIKTTMAFSMKHKDPEELLSVFGLVKSLNENLNCIDENNRVREFSSIKEIVDSFISIRLGFYQKRKRYLLESLKKELEILVSKYLFGKGIIDGTIKVSNVKKEIVVSQLEKIEKIVKIDGTYSYLLNMGIISITSEKILDLKETIRRKKDEFMKIKETDIKDMWLEDLEIVEKGLKHDN